MPHALLLTGEKGVGKRTLAHLLGQGLLCTGEGDKPCGQCRNCRRFIARTHPNALFPAPLPKEKSIKIESVRKAIDSLSRPSLEGGKQVMIVEQADHMTPQAQNCLLKTLEEPRDDAVILLTCDAESSLLPTIRSRCRIIRMQPWAQSRLEEALLLRGIDPPRARKLALYCEGSIGRALEMHKDEEYWAARETVSKSFLAVRRSADLAGAAQVLKNAKDQGELLLDILEQQLRALLHSLTQGGQTPPGFPAWWSSARPTGVRRIMDALMDARRQKNANVGWAALTEGLMQSISEEVSTWQV